MTKGETGATRIRISAVRIKNSTCTPGAWKKEYILGRRAAAALSAWRPFPSQRLMANVRHRPQQRNAKMEENVHMQRLITWWFL